MKIVIQILSLLVVVGLFIYISQSKGKSQKSVASIESRLPCISSGNITRECCSGTYTYDDKNNNLVCVAGPKVMNEPCIESGMYKGCCSHNFDFDKAGNRVCTGSDDCLSAGKVESKCSPNNITQNCTRVGYCCSGKTVPEMVNNKPTGNWICID